MFWSAQILAFIICVISTTSYLAKKKSTYLYMQLAVNVLYCGQYFLLGAFSGAVSNIISLAKYILFAHNAKIGKENSKTSMLIFCILSVVLGAFAINGWHTFIPIITAVIFTYAIWQDNPVVLRIIVIICNIMWIVFNFKVKAYVSALYSFCELVFAFVTLINLVKKGEKYEL